ncbi:hypothetical protein GCM10009104_29380 [Marinobacterium maritimum]|uniref:Uncharacterized protein n=1 Tax=Marinobacterium maritimum TaxID=500162 RepID=A0ABN1I968_9GAMM
MHLVLITIGVVSLLLAAFFMAKARLLMWKHRQSNTHGVFGAFSVALVKGGLDRYVEANWVSSIKRHAFFGLALFTIAVWCLGISASGL